MNRIEKTGRTVDDAVQAALKELGVSREDVLIEVLEEGKDADIAIFDGHPFSSLSACRMTIIDGKIVHDTLTK